MYLLPTAKQSLDKKEYPTLSSFLSPKCPHISNHTTSNIADQVEEELPVFNCE